MPLKSGFEPICGWLGGIFVLYLLIHCFARKIFLGSVVLVAEYSLYMLIYKNNNLYKLKNVVNLRCEI